MQMLKFKREIELKSFIHYYWLSASGTAQDANYELDTPGSSKYVNLRKYLGSILTEYGKCDI